LLEPPQVAEILNVKVSQVYTLMRSGQLRALKIGARGVWRVHEDDLNEYIESLRDDARRRAPEDLAVEEFIETE
jgi:excisionase family DNA binding protein